MSGCVILDGSIAARKNGKRLPCEVLQAENAKLLELVGIMRTCIEHACLCDFCPLFVAEDMDEPRCIAEMDSRMRELGIEVDE